MSILDKYPAPWRPMRHGPECTAYDANGVLVAEIGDGKHGREDLQRLILAAPELLAALNDVLDHFVPSRPSGYEAMVKATELVNRLEGEP